MKNISSTNFINLFKRLPALQVFLYVSSATLDLSVFGGDQTALIESLRSTHRSVRFRSFPEQRKAFVEGPLSAVKNLREDLISRAKRLQASAQTAADKPKDTSSEPRGTPYPGIVGSEGFSGAKAMRKPWSSGSLQQNTVEVKDLNRRTEALSTQNVSNESSARERFRHVTGAESNAEVGSLSRLELNSVKEKSATHQRRGSVSEKRNQSERSHSKLGSSVTNTNISKSREVTGSSDESSPEDILVDLYTFEYIKKFHKRELDICLRDVDTTTCDEGGGLLRISLIENNPSKMSRRRLKTALEQLKSLLEFWNEFLRVHKIPYKKPLTKEKLTLICNRANSLYVDVLYIFEDSHVKVIGPSASSYQFYNKVEGEVAKCLCELKLKTV